MKKYILEFLRRALMACWLGPVILAVSYLIAQRTAGVETLSVRQVCIGIFSLSALAFVAGGINVLYQVERLPLMAAILIHGIVLYACYLGTYLVNDWLEWGSIQIMVFSGIFILGYLVIWAVIYSVVKRHTKKLNEMLKKQQQNS